MRGSEGTAKFSLPLLPVVPRISSLSVQGGNLPEREVRGRGREARKTLKRMVVLVSRHGRRLQRYSSGRRLVVGELYSDAALQFLLITRCIPYKLKEVDEPCSEDTEPAIEVLVVSSQKGPELMFPKGGWELDESMPEAASREAFEEAGVRGSFEVSSQSLRLHNPDFPAIAPQNVAFHRTACSGCRARLANGPARGTTRSTSCTR
ncbi:Nudix hydrolase [Musa troglodytarum]|uniref:Nudix hydrolase n=1 Tax=Musa troglodytarum TaxID=320322 RepID=A0A9E7JVP3_9LILI|nr:Nudix hydrolase [Musa troglodytarum]